MKGIIHSTETFGTVDGPGIRYIVFMQGCPLKCKYCHNRDTWNIKLGKECTIEELINDMKRYQNYYKFSGGGLTISGGEPTLQAEFVTELLKTVKSEGFHTCLDTSGFVDIEKINNFYCSFESTGKDSFPLRIARVNKEANASQLYVVRLMLAAPYDAQKVTPGMTAMVYAEIPKRENEGNVCIPSSSILYQDAKTQVFVYRSDLSTIHLREIKVQSINRDGTMLVEGVKAGENIVLSGVHHLKDGQKVKVLQKPSPSNVGGLL